MYDPPVRPLFEPLDGVAPALIPRDILGEALIGEEAQLGEADFDGAGLGEIKQEGTE